MVVGPGNYRVACAMTADDVAVEMIPDDATLSRSIYFPAMRGQGQQPDAMEPLNVFIFSRDNGYRVSVIWRQYCPDLDCVNRLGCEKQQRDVTERTDPNHPRYSSSFDPAKYRYVGSIEGQACTIRSVRGDAGTSLGVVHAPDDGQGIHHAEIRMELPGNAQLTARQKKLERNEVKRRLYMQFSELFPHTCL